MEVAGFSGRCNKENIPPLADNQGNLAASISQFCSRKKGTRRLGLGREPLRDISHLFINSPIRSAPAQAPAGHRLPSSTVPALSSNQRKRKAAEGIGSVLHRSDSKSLRMNFR